MNTYLLTAAVATAALAISAAPASATPDPEPPTVLPYDLGFASESITVTEDGTLYAVGYKYIPVTTGANTPYIKQLRLSTVRDGQVTALETPTCEKKQEFLGSAGDHTAFVAPDDQGGVWWYSQLCGLHKTDKAGTSTVVKAGGTNGAFMTSARLHEGNRAGQYAVISWATTSPKGVDNNQIHTQLVSADGSTRELSSPLYAGSHAPSVVDIVEMRNGRVESIVQSYDSVMGRRSNEKTLSYETDFDVYYPPTKLTGTINKHMSTHYVGSLRSTATQERFWFYNKRINYMKEPYENGGCRSGVGMVYERGSWCPGFPKPLADAQQAPTGPVAVMEHIGEGETTADITVHRCTANMFRCESTSYTVKPQSPGWPVQPPLVASGHNTGQRVWFGLDTHVYAGLADKP